MEFTREDLDTIYESLRLYLYELENSVFSYKLTEKEEDKCEELMERIRESVHNG